MKKLKHNAEESRKHKSEQFEINRKQEITQQRNGKEQTPPLPKDKPLSSWPEVETIDAIKKARKKDAQAERENMEMDRNKAERNPPL